jgi:hypothetical protein
MVMRREGVKEEILIVWTYSYLYNNVDKTNNFNDQTTIEFERSEWI